MSRRSIRYAAAMVAIAALSGANAVRAQQAGGIRGAVYDSDFDAPLPGATVRVAETGESVATSEEGLFSLGNLPPGTYTIVIQKEGYAQQVRSNVVVAGGALTEIDASLAGDFVEMEEFVVQDVQFEAGTEAALLELRFESPALMDSISADLMSKAGAGDAASALTLVSGTTVQDGKYAVVRGLPDRYVNSQLNGIRLPTADADKRAVQLDQFPSAAIESIHVSKTFTPDQQGDASGGAVNVVLKGIPEKSGISVSTQTSYNTNVTGNSDFLTYDGGGFNYWGEDDGSRDVTEQPIGENWDGAAGVSRGDAPIDYKWGLSAGGKRELNDDLTIGGFGSFFYERDSSYFEDGIDDSYWVTTPGGPMVPQTSQGGPSTGDFKTSLFDVTQGTREVKWGALGAVGLETEDHSLTFSSLYTRDAEDTATLLEDTRGKEHFFPGYDPEDPEHPGNQNRDAAPYLRLETLKYTERETRTNQLRGTHTLMDPEIEFDGFFKFLSPEVDWSVSKSTASLAEPDKRQFGSAWYPEQELFPGFTLPAVYVPYKPSANFTLGNFQRISKEIDEESDQYSVNVKLPFEQWTRTEGYFKFGAFKDEVDREYVQDSFSNFNDNSTWAGDWDDYWSDVFPDQDHPITAATVDVDYIGKQDITAWYYMADIPLVPWFSVIGGARHETTELSIVNIAEEDATWFRPGTNTPAELGPGDADVDFQQDDVLPSIGFKFAPHEKTTLRGTYSETVARQTFKELSPILQQEFLGGDIFIGNPELGMSALKNYDLRFDYTPFEESLLSASYFFKDVTDPIEYVQRLGNGFAYTTPVNYPEGQLSGWEFEARQGLGKLWSPLDGLSLGANATLIDSEVTLSDEEAALFEQSNIRAPMKTREMTNAPEHLYNVYATYEMGKLGLPNTELALFYTVRGDTLVAGAGESNGYFVPSIYETEYGTLNASLTQKFGETWTVKLQAKNLLDPDIETVYRSDYIDGDVTKTSYKKGMEFSIGVAATF